MSQEIMELSRAYHDEIARASQEGDPEAMVSKMAELWDASGFSWPLV